MSNAIPRSLLIAALLSSIAWPIAVVATNQNVGVIMFLPLLLFTVMAGVAVGLEQKDRNQQVALAGTNRRSDKGFTLTEVSIVLGILGLLVVLGVGGFVWIQRAQSSVTDSEATTAAQLIRDDLTRNQTPKLTEWATRVNKDLVDGWPSDTTLEADSYWIQALRPAPTTTDAVTQGAAETVTPAVAGPTAKWVAGANTAYRFIVTGAEATDWRCALVVAYIDGTVSGGTLTAEAPLANTADPVQFIGVWYQSAGGTVAGGATRACDPITQADAATTACQNNFTPNALNTGHDSSTVNYRSCLSLNSNNQWQVNTDHVLARTF